MDPSYEETDFSQADDLVRDRQRYYPRAKKAQHIINQLLARSAYGQQKSSGDLDEAWKDAIGTRWQALTRVGKLNRGILEIYVTNSTLGQHLNFEKKRVLKILQDRLPQNKIKDIRFKVGPID